MMLAGVIDRVQKASMSIHTHKHTHTHTQTQIHTHTHTKMLKPSGKSPNETRKAVTVQQLKNNKKEVKTHKENSK